MEEERNEDLPVWKKDLIVKRKDSEILAKRTTDVLESRLLSRDEIAMNKTADIIKFFNQVADGDTGAQTRFPPHHLPIKPGINIHPKTRNGMLKRDEGGVTTRQAVRSHREYPNRHDLLHLTPSPVLSTLQSEECGTSRLQNSPETFSDSFDKNRHIPEYPLINQDIIEVVQADIVIFSDSDEDDTADKNCRYVTNRYSDDSLGSQPMGEDKRLFLSNARSEIDPRGLGGVGSRVQRSRLAGKRNVGRDNLIGGGGGGDSDGMMGSGGESDSSEEIHYGPGFVSRLKSRYMSVALRGTPRGTIGTLRRTASLEDFLEIERSKQDENREAGVRSPVQKYQSSRSSYGRINSSTSGVVSQAKSKRESMKRAQSVEVLSILNDSPKPRDSVLSDAFFKNDILPPSESPPPLPPREKTEQSNVNLVLNTAPALVNDIVIIEEKPGPGGPTIQTIQPKPSFSRSKYSSSVTKPVPKPPSAGVLFGVKDRELPAPDTVKQTRKLFESEKSGLTESKVIATNGLTKAKSTSSLYTKPVIKSLTSEKIKKKNSEEDLPKSVQSSNAMSGRTGLGRKTSSKPVSRPSGSRFTSGGTSSGSPVRTGSRESLLRSQKNSSPSVSRPAIPAKPSHLSPIVNINNPFRTALSDATRSSGLNNVLTKVRKESPILNEPPPNEVENVRLNLQPVTKKIHSEDTSSNTEHPESEEGTKKISADSIQNIRKDGNVMSFNFPEFSPGSKSHLPGSPVSSTSPSNKQVGVIKPISRDAELDIPEIRPRSVIISPDKTNNNKKTDSVHGQSWSSNPQKHIKTTVEQSAPELIKPSSSKPVITNGWEKSPPVIPPRNGSKLEHSASPKPKITEKYFDSNIEAEPSPPGARKELNISDEGKVDVTDKAGGGGGYRENWKARQEKQNTLVFNFTNTKKDVSHIENDGLDLTNRTSKKGVVYLDSNGESCDGIVSEEDSELISSYTFIGAFITTGKSSIRTKNSSKKLTITWKDETEVFEYPSFESSKEEDLELPLKTLKSNTPVGTSGGLGSYTPSKIQMTETPFQLGVSRSIPSHLPSPTLDTSQSSPSSDTYLRPSDTGVSWGSSESSDILF